MTSRSRRPAGPSPRRVLLVAICVAAALLAGAIAMGCSADREQVAARVGGEAIAKSTVAHWTSVVRRGGTVPILSQTGLQTPRERALEFLIVSRWLIGEASALGLPISEQSVATAIAARQRAMPGGAREFKESLEVTGETDADVRLKARAELATRGLRAALARIRLEVAPSVARAYFNRHIHRFAIPERRKVDLVERIGSFAAAARLKRAIEAGRAPGRLTFHESLTESDTANESPPVARAIFEAPKGVLGGPMHLPSGFILFRVTRILPEQLRDFASLRGTITRNLLRQRSQSVRARFDQRWESTWTARTSCSTGYVVPQCREHGGSRPPPRNPFLL